MNKLIMPMAVVMFSLSMASIAFEGGQLNPPSAKKVTAPPVTTGTLRLGA